jgi:amino-acid N-acetyltransferase
MTLRTAVHVPLHVPATDSVDAVRVRRATPRDLPELEVFIARFTGDGTLLPRPRANLLHHLGDFRVARDGRGRLVGCGALQRVHATLAEVRSLAVDPRAQGGGIGSRLVRALTADARRLGVRRVFCLTRRPQFFARLGFEVVAKEKFPHKIWNDCMLCPRQSSCDEIAMERAIGAPA